LSATSSSLLASDSSGNVIATSTIGSNLIKGPASSIFAFDNSGSAIATTSIGTNYLTGTLGTINGTGLNAGGSITITAASSTLLANNNTFSGNNVFAASTTFSLVNISNASTSLATFGSLWIPSITNALLSTNNNGQVVSTSSIGTNLLAGALGTINGQTLNAGSSVTITAASSSLLTDNNTFTGRNAFSLIKLSATSSSLLASDSSGNVIATTSIG